MSVVILGAGVTGLAAGIASGAPVFEARDVPGGICSSYYVRPGRPERLAERPPDGEAYRFEVGGGHWIFGGDAAVLARLSALAPLEPHVRVASVFFPDRQLTVPYPLQDHVHVLGDGLAGRVRTETSAPAPDARTMAGWLRQRFGPTLYDLFFAPFHRLYTAGLYERIAPQDAYKSPVDARPAAAGYNATYLYPVGGLDVLARGMAAECEVHYGKRAVAIDAAARTVTFDDGTRIAWDALLSTLPLNVTMRMAGVEIAPAEDPYTSVLVLNIGARRGPRTLDDHWLYVPHSRAGFHRVGFYDNVTVDFLPTSARPRHDRVALYVERAYDGGRQPAAGEASAYAAAVIDELRAWGFIDEVEVLDATWIDVAYTWSWPGSTWVHDALAALAARGIHQVGRYGRWIFQGIADSVRDGLAAGAAWRHG